MKKQAGFSLVEMVTVLGVMSILSVMAVGAFMSYGARTQAGEGLRVTEGLRSGFSTYYADLGRVPPQTLVDLFGAGAAGSLLTDHMGKYVASVDVENGHLVITYGINADPVLAGDILTMTPYETRGGGIIWQCGTSGVPIDSLAVPLELAGSVAGAPVGTLTSVTTLDTEFLPRDCR
ncbi:MAG: pilin [Planctomycetota bacterium]|jgi:prepilin-type N-terminal cleavage/methylation domain-containing protein